MLYATPSFALPWTYVVVAVVVHARMVFVAVADEDEEQP